MMFTKEDHPKYPPESWQVRKHGRKWGLYLTPDAEYPSQTFATKREAEEAKTKGFYVTLYAKEGRWYAGEHIQGWKPFSESWQAKAAPMTQEGGK